MIAKKIAKAVGGASGMALGVGMQVWSTVGDYKRFKEEGNSPLVAGIKSAGSFVFYDMIGNKFPWLIAAQTGYNLAKQAGQTELNAAERLYDRAGRFGAGFVPTTEAGYTMRQRSINAIRQNGLNVNSVFGNEARQYFGRE